MVTAELALVVPVLLVVLALCVSGLGLAVDQVRCVDAARVAARAASRGDAERVVREVAARGAPEGSVVILTRRDREIDVVVRAPVRRLLPGLPAGEGRAVAVLEPGVQHGRP